MLGPDWDRLAASHLSAHPDWADLWSQLQPIYRAFEERRIVPAITITKDGRYVLDGR